MYKYDIMKRFNILNMAAEQPSRYQQVENIPSEQNEKPENNGGNCEKRAEVMGEIRKNEQSDKSSSADPNKILEGEWLEADADNTTIDTGKAHQEFLESANRGEKKQIKEKIKGLLKGKKFGFLKKWQLKKDLIRFVEVGINVDERFVGMLPGDNDRLGGWGEAILQLSKEGVDVSNIKYFNKRSLSDLNFLAAVRYFGKAEDFLKVHDTYSMKDAVKNDLLSKGISNLNADKEWARLFKVSE